MTADRITGSGRRRLVPHMLERRRTIAANLPVWTRFQEWEESCVPSYCHPNIAAAYVSWLRLFRAEAVARKLGASGPILDFGSSIGELGHLIDPFWEYQFIEQDEAPVAFLKQSLPRSIRTTLEDAPKSTFGCVFALDSLEHNIDYESILDKLAEKLSRTGILVISGPTENWLYRAGRKLAGFSSHYHLTTVANIEAAAARSLTPRYCTTVPLGIPLFRISAWSID